MTWKLIKRKCVGEGSIRSSFINKKNNDNNDTFYFAAYCLYTIRSTLIRKIYDITAVVSSEVSSSRFAGSTDKKN